MKKIGVLGCTGSVGRTALKVIACDEDKEVVFLLNNTDLDGLKEQIAVFNPYVAVCLDKKYLYRDGKEYFCDNIKDYLSEFISYCDIVINGIVGLAGLVPTIETMKAGKILATANKESFVCAGKIINEYKDKFTGEIRPLDSEHSAVWQLIDGKNNVDRIIITASGGAFRDKTAEELKFCSAEDALKHPNWIMGKKVTIDCATLMNKGMEIIEAKHLFGRKAEVIGHRESYVHAIVQYADGTYNANISYPDMSVPVSYALNYPEIKDAHSKKLDLTGKSLNFFPLNEVLFPCLAIAEWVADSGDIAGTIMSSADEILVQRYLADEIGFYDIPYGIKKALDKFGQEGDFSSVEEVFSMDKQVREYTLNMRFGGII